MMYTAILFSDVSLSLQDCLVVVQCDVVYTKMVVHIDFDTFKGAKIQTGYAAKKGLTIFNCFKKDRTVINL